MPRVFSRRLARARTSELAVLTLTALRRLPAAVGSHGLDLSFVTHLFIVNEIENAASHGLWSYSDAA